MNVPVAAVIEKFCITLLFKFAIFTAAELDIPVFAPMPVLVPAMMLLVEMASVPEPPVFTIPLNTEAPELYVVQF